MSRALVRRSRGRLGWLLAGFVLCQVILAVAIDRWLGAVRDPEYAAKLRHLRERLAEAPGRPLVLVLGSSRTAFGLDARSLSTSGGSEAVVFNFGQMGGGPLLELVTLRRLLADGIRPALVYAEIVPNMFAERDVRLMEERLLDGARFRWREVRQLHGYYHQPYRLLGTYGLGRGLPCYRHQAELRAGILPAGKHFGPTDQYGLDSHGWHPRLDNPSAEYRRATSEMAREQNDDFGSCTTLAAGPVRALEDLLTLCRRHNIPVTLFRMPEAKPFRELYQPAARAALAGLLGRLWAERGVGLVNAEDWVPDNYFWDTHHLLAEGARLFTERFGREALRPALSGLRCAARGPRS